MMINVSVRFLILIAPTGVDAALKPCYSVCNRAPVWSLYESINHNINGVLYSIGGSRYRTDLLNLCYRKE